MIHPIQFAIPSENIVPSPPTKREWFSKIIPGDGRTYIYKAWQEESYHSQYQQSYFALTRMKAGWDGLRHYEILANGCVPYFVKLEEMPEKVMTWFPKKLLLEAKSMPGVHEGSVDESFFDKDRYADILNQLLNYTRKYLTTEYLARYVIEKMELTSPERILFLSGTHRRARRPDYQRCLLLHGLKTVFGDRVVDYPKSGTSIESKTVGFEYCTEIGSMVVVFPMLSDCRISKSIETISRTGFVGENSTV